MEPVSPILDYASPRSRVKIRLPSNSVIRCTSDDRSCVVHETLSGKKGAIGALFFAGCVVCIVLATGLAIPNATPSLLGFVAAEAGVIILVALMVIRNTWRQTLLRVVDGQMTLAFTAPLTPSKHYAWHVGSIERIEVVSSDLPTLGELRITPDVGPEVHLFTDHSVFDLQSIARSLETAMHATTA